VSTTKRFYFEAYGRDDEALKEGFSWLTSESVGGRGVVAVPALRQVESLVPGINAAEARQLAKAKSLARPGVTIELATERTHASVSGVPVLAVWVDDEMLEELEHNRPSALCVIPWREEEIARWCAAHAPTEMRTGASSGAVTVSNPVVERALETLTARVNLSSGLGHPSDKAAAVGAFRILRGGGEAYDVGEVDAWAANHGWGLHGARELVAIAQGVLDGRNYRVGRHGWREDILEQWRVEARG
jgi:hypothetical protein